MSDRETAKAVSLPANCTSFLYLFAYVALVAFYVYVPVASWSTLGGCYYGTVVWYHFVLSQVKKDPIFSVIGNLHCLKLCGVDLRGMFNAFDLLFSFLPFVPQNHRQRK